jgi:hypothetical protein
MNKKMNCKKIMKSEQEFEKHKKNSKNQPANKK